MKPEHYTFRFTSNRPAADIFERLLHIEQWWFGLFDEHISGKSEQPGDEFIFEAGGGLHVTKQKLLELEPTKKIVWSVTSSKLSFLSEPGEWQGTKICFELRPLGTGTEVIFTHEGLVPHMECYNSCSSAWTGYMTQLQKNLS